MLGKSVLIAIVSFVMTSATLAEDVGHIYRVRCGADVMHSVDGLKQVCWGYTRHPDRYQDYLVLDTDNGSLVYEIVAQRALNPEVTQKAVTISKDGITSEIVMDWVYEAGTYPGDGDNYATSMRGTTPDGLQFLVMYLNEIVIAR